MQKPSTKLGTTDSGLMHPTRESIADYVVNTPMANTPYLSANGRKHPALQLHAQGSTLQSVRGSKSQRQIGANFNLSLDARSNGQAELCSNSSHFTTSVMSIAALSHRLKIVRRPKQLELHRAATARASENSVTKMIPCRQPQEKVEM